MWRVAATLEGQCRMFLLSQKVLLDSVTLDEGLTSG